MTSPECSSVGPPLFRSYSLSGPVSTEHYRISVKVEPNGAGGTYLRVMSGWAMLSTSVRRAEASFYSRENGRWCCSARESGRRCPGDATHPGGDPLAPARDSEDSTSVR
jgi:hypothetical protein